MKFSLTSIILLSIICFAFLACDKEDDDHMHDSDVEYHAHILEPSPDVKKVGDRIPILVAFEDHKGGTIHHVSVQVINEDSGEAIFDQPAGEDRHVHASSGKYEVSDSLTLSVSPNSNWLVVARVWGMEAGMHEAADTVRFHVHPN